MLVNSVVDISRASSLTNGDIQSLMGLFAQRSLKPLDYPSREDALAISRRAGNGKYWTLVALSAREIQERGLEPIAGIFVPTTSSRCSIPQEGPDITILNAEP